MDIEREWRRDPPSEPMDNLEALVKDFIVRFPRERRDMVVEFCRAALSLESAIRRAVASKDGRGVHHNHQSKIKREAYHPMTQKLLAWESIIARCPSFDHLHDVVANSDVPGWGPVGWYDIATRIGAYLKLEPESVYLHAGVRQGWEALMRNSYSKVKRVPREYWPEPLKVLTADECEDFLCTYRSVFDRIEV